MWNRREGITKNFYSGPNNGLLRNLDNDGKKIWRHFGIPKRGFEYNERSLEYGLLSLGLGVIILLIMSIKHVCCDQCYWTICGDNANSYFTIFNYRSYL